VIRGRAAEGDPLVFGSSDHWTDSPPKWELPAPASLKRKEGSSEKADHGDIQMDAEAEPRASYPPFLRVRVCVPSKELSLDTDLSSNELRTTSGRAPISP
jgi:hypothetical protein